MPSGITLAYDVTAGNYAHVPAGQRAGYVTGSGGVPWTPAMWAANPGAVRIDQSPVNTPLDELADVIDFENGAAVLSDLARWVLAAQANFARGARPGQRKPAVYCSASNATAAVNALVAGGVAGGVGLWFAHYGVPQASATASVLAGSGPFPCIGFQFSDLGGGGTYDLDVFSAAWLAGQSGVAGSTVAEGSSGPAVRALQQRLVVWGAKLATDALFGSGTLAALKSFQGARKLAVDGVAGPATWKALDASPVPSAPVSGPSGAPLAAIPAPLDLRQSVFSVGAGVSFRWGAVPGTASYELQAEYYKDGFGWVLSVQETVTAPQYAVTLAPATKFRWRVAAAPAGHAWSAWVEFTTP
jgi:peptidoglycan hydrolase-like protein with peptidoglycan-binding domain